MGALDEDGPVFGDRELAVERGWFQAGFDVDSDVELAFGFAAKDAVGGRDVGVVATNGGTDVAVVGDEVVGGVEADPVEVGQEDFDPGVG